jgi:cation transport protein ChaC
MTTLSPPEAGWAIAFVINRSHARYAGMLPEEKVASVIAGARGPLGACATYLFNTTTHLAQLGIPDRHLERLRNRVAEELRRLKVEPE